MFAGLPTNIVLGLLAGMTIFLGLPVARIKGISESARGMLALASAGVLFFLIIEVGFRAIETLEITAKGGDLVLATLQGLILIAGLLFGLVGLAAIEENRHQAKSEGASPLEIANMIAIGIGLHNFAEGLAIGQSYSSGNTNLGLILVLGFALHNATEGFGIAGPLAGLDISWPKLIGLGLIAGAPTAVGAGLGGVLVNTNLELFILSLAVGSLIYVTRELLRLRFTTLNTAKAMFALSLGLIVGVATEIYIEVASVNDQQNQKSNEMPSKEIAFTQDEIEPDKLTVERGNYLTLINETDKPLEIESQGLTSKEIFIPRHGRLATKVIGTAGKYILTPEGSTLIAEINVLPGKENMPEIDVRLIVANLTTLEGHVRAAYDLHVRSQTGHSPDSKIDLARAGKHAYHPMHELLEDQTPQSLLVQSSLEKIGLLDEIKDKLRNFSHLAGDPNTDNALFSKEYAELIATAEKARQLIAGDLYKNPAFRANAALIVLEKAEGEYKEAVETGKFVVAEPAQPGKDGYLEYQDTRGFLKAAKTLLAYPSNKLCTSAQEEIDRLLTAEFKDVDPKNPDKPTSFKEIEERFEKIENILKQLDNSDSTH